MSERTLGTYQMLWDCPYCGTKKLLGLTHRHCPGCGAPQDPARRYFPSDEEKVAVEDHVYIGADLLCSACDSPSSARARHCGNCGAPLAGEKEVARKPDAPASASAPAAARVSSDPPRRRPRRLLLGCLGLTLAAIAVTILATSWKKPATLRVAGHAWSRAIDIEVKADRRESAWCDSLPADARDVSRRREVRSHNRVPDGQDCSTSRQDMGDGTYREVERCTPRYRDEPVYADRCHFTVLRWGPARTLAASGSGLDPEPRWPAVKLERAGDCAGCEREGGRREGYRVKLDDASRGDLLECELPRERWAALAPGSRWKAPRGVLTGKVDCTRLEPAP